MRHEGGYLDLGELDTRWEQAYRFAQRKLKSGIPDKTSRRGGCMHPRRAALLLVFLLVRSFALSGVAAFGQSVTATLSGTVVDQQNLVVPGVKITVRNKDTSLLRERTTDHEGYFSVPELPPGAYTVSASCKGFATAEIQNVVLNVNDQRSLRVQLTLAGAEQRITVTSEVPLINTSPAVASVVDRQFVENLPLNGRSFQTLIDMTPGVAIMRADSQNPGQFSVNGQRTNANYFTVDGISANFGTNNFAGFNQTATGSIPALNLQGGFNSLVSVEGLQEFQIQTSSYAPEFGRAPGAQVVLLTRSGTNRYHGSLFEYLRNDKADATDWFVNSLALRKPPLRYNDFGGSFGGPVRLPRYDGHDHTFFFFTYEGARFVLPQAPAITVVPSAAARQNAPNDAAKQILISFPFPNGPNIVDASGALTGGAIYTASYSNPSSSDAWSLRLDHNFNQKYALFGRYNRSVSDSRSRSTNNLSENNLLGTNTDTLTLGASQVFTTRLVNEVRMNASKQDGTTQWVFDGLGGGVQPPDSIAFPPNTPAGKRRAVLTLNGLVGNTGLGFTSTSFGTVELNSNRQVQVLDNLSLARGPHQFKFGADYRYISPVIAPGFVPSINFANLQGIYTGVTNLIIAIRQAQFALVYNTFSAYAQDTWKVNTRLSVTYGVRWELNPAPHGKNGKNPLTVQQLGALSSNDFSYLALAPPGTALYDTVFTNFAPRLGASYQLAQHPGRELVLRGGFGIMYDTGQNGFGAISFPYSLSKVFPGATVPAQPVIADLPPPNFTPSPTNRVSITVPARDYRLPRTYQWNVTLDKSLGKEQVLSVAYVGALGRDWERTSTITLAATNANPDVPYSPNFSTLTLIGNGSYSDYHALQMQFRRRMSHGLQATAAYTWSHSIDNGSSDSARVIPDRIASPNIDRGDSDFDVRQSATAALTYNIPAPKGKGFARALTSNWSIDSIFLARTSPPFSLISDESQSQLGTRFQRRPDIVPGLPQVINDPNAPGGKRVNKAAFVVLPGTSLQAQGMQGRNSLRLFGMWQDDFAVHRQFKLRESLGLQFRLEMFNIFNHPNFAEPGQGSPFTQYLFQPDNVFGRAASMLGRGLGGGGNDGGFNPLFQIAGPRSMQFALRLQF